MDSISVRAIIEYEGKFLLVRNKSFTSPDFWCLPGGGMESGESVFAALERELVEEIGIKPEIGNLIYVHQVKEAEGNFSAPELFFHIKNSKDYLNHNVLHSTHGKRELDEIDWVDITKVNILPKFLANELPDIALDRFNVNTRIRLE